MTVSALTDRTAIQELKHAYCYHLDDGDPDDFAQLFAPDAHLAVSVYGTASGRDGLRRFVEWADESVDRMAHLVANPVIDVETGKRGDSRTASGNWYYVVVLELPDGTVEFGQGRYDDTFRRVDGEWRFATVTAARQVGVPLG